MNFQFGVRTLVIFSTIFKSTLQTCQPASENDYELETEIWLQWYSTDDPSDGEDVEQKTNIYNSESLCSGDPVDVECRTKFSKVDHVTAGQTVTCDTTSGFLCRNVDQAIGVTCYDYEIRFKCMDSSPLPKPEYDLDTSGKASVSDMDPVRCDGISTKVYDKVGPLVGTSINNRHYYQTDGPPNSHNACAMWPAGSSSLTFLPLMDGICFSRPLCCEHGLTVEFWGYSDEPQTNSNALYFSTGGTHDGHPGITVFIKSSKITCETRFTLPSGDNQKMSLTANDVLGSWYHVVCTYNRTDSSTCLYIDATLVECEDPVDVSTLDNENYDDLRLFSRNKQPVENVASSTSTDAKVSDMRVYFYHMTAAEVTDLYSRQTSGAYVHVYYIGRVSEDSEEVVVLECKGHGSFGNHLSYRWFTSPDGDTFTEIDPSVDQSVYVYTDVEPNDYQSVSRLHFIDHPKVDTIYACEGYDPTTMATSSQMFTLTFDPDVTTWTPWISSDEPDDGDDVETLANVRMVYPQVCSNPIDVECRTLYSKENHTSTGQVFAESCTVSNGLHCIGSQQTGVCLDYEVRFLCIGVNYRWTSWYNDFSPGAEDMETFDNHTANGHPDLCLFPLFAECRTVPFDVLWHQASNNQLTYPYICNKNGLWCKNSDNPSNCPDFEVRYACPYYPAVDPDFQWEFGGRTSLSEDYPTDCGSLSLSSFPATHPDASASGTSNKPLTFVSTHPSVRAACAEFLDGSSHIDLGNYSFHYITDASRCDDGSSFSFWFRPTVRISVTNDFFISSGSHMEDGKGISFYQWGSTAEYVIGVKTRKHAFQAEMEESTFPLFVWTHVHVSIDPPNGFTYYLNGTYEGRVTTFGTSTYNVATDSAATNLVLGAKNNDFGKNGYGSLSDFRIYSTALKESHVDAFGSCGEANGDVTVSSLNRTSHHLDFDLSIDCVVWGHPEPTVEWLWFDDISQEGAPQAVGLGVSISESTSVVGCWKMLELFIPDYAYSVYANKTIICKAKNDVQHDIDSIHLDILDPCEYTLGIHTGKFTNDQFEDSVDGVLPQVPALDSASNWNQLDASRMLIVDLGVKHTIVGVALQAHESFGGPAYDTQVTVEYMDADSNWQLFEVFSLVDIESSPQTFWFAFAVPQDTTKLRFKPETFNLATMFRIELNGCRNDVFSGTVTLSGPSIAEPGDTVTLSCNVSGENVNSLDWYFIPDTMMNPQLVSDGANGITLTEPSSVISIGGIANLSIASIDQSHGGTYICSVNNHTESDLLSLSFSDPEGNITLASNDTRYDPASNSFRLSCAFVSDGDYLNTSWLIPDGSEIFGNQSSSKYQFTSVEGTAQLVVKSFNFSTDVGNYTCKGYTSGGGEEEHWLDISYAYSGPLSLEVINAVRIGETVSLECVAGDPTKAFDIQWYHSPSQESMIGTVPLTNSRSHQITTWMNTTDGLMSNLQIGLFSIPENGRYICSVNGWSKTINVSISDSKSIGDIIYFVYHPMKIKIRQDFELRQRNVLWRVVIEIR